MADHAKTGLVLPSGLYDTARNVVNFGIPAVAAFYSTLAGIFGLPYAVQVVAAAGAFVVLANVFLKISKKNYNNSPDRIDGEVTVDTTQPDGALVGLDFLNKDPEVLAGKDTVTLKVNANTASQ